MMRFRDIGARTFGFDRNARRSSRNFERLHRIQQGVRPGDSIALAIARLGDEGGTVTLAAGTHTVHESISSSVNNLRIVGTKGAIVRTAPDFDDRLFVLSGDDQTIQDIEFLEDVTSASFTIAASGDRFVLQNCLFTDCYRALTLSGDDGMVQSNRVVAARAGTNAITVSGDGNMIANNVVPPAVITNGIYATDAAQNNTFTGNVSDVSFKNALGNANAGNTGTVTAR